MDTPSPSPVSGARAPISSRGAPQYTVTPEIAVQASTEYSVYLDSGMTDEASGSFKTSEPPPADDDPLVGATLSDTYRVLRILGEGGMGRVYEAQHTRIASKRFAVKALHPEFSRRKEVLVRFQREVEAAASIDSPHVVGVYDVGETDDGRPYLVSELLQGEELGDYLDRVRMMSIGPAVRIVRQVCEALVAAHAVGVVHRDVKSENVFLSGDIAYPTAKVLDFGISRLEGQGGNTLTKTGMVMGTPSYMAPEQARGAKVDHRTDIYATGAILYRALTGKLPFDRSDATATLAAVLTEEPERPRAIAPHIPEALELVIQRAMAREPEDRYQSMNELFDALGPFDDEQALAAVDASGKRPRLPSSSLATIVGGAENEVRAARPQAAFLLTLALGGALFSLVAIAGAAIRLIRAGDLPTLTGTEALVIALVVLAAVTTPLVMIIRHVLANLWANTAKIIELVSVLREPVLVGFAASGLTELMVRVLEAVVWRTTTGASSAHWDLLVPAVGVVAGLVTVSWKRSVKKSGGGVGGTVLAIAAATIVGGMVFLLSAVGAKEAPPEWDFSRAPSSSAVDYGSTAPPATAAPSSSAGKSGTNPRAQQAWNELLTASDKKQWPHSLDLLEQLIAADPTAAEDHDVRNVVMEVAKGIYYAGGANSQRMTALLTGTMGKSGPDVMFELVVTAGGSQAAATSQRLLQDESVRARGSEALRIAYALRTAKSCDETANLAERAATHGDKRAVRELSIAVYCRRGARCCRDHEQIIKSAITAIEARK